VPTATSSREQELLDQLALLRAQLNKSVYDFDVVVSPKRVKSFKWMVNIEHTTLEGLKYSIRAVYHLKTIEGMRNYFSRSLMLC
jgi:hypothetical protein